MMLNFEPDVSEKQWWSRNRLHPFVFWIASHKGPSSPCISHELTACASNKTHNLSFLITPVSLTDDFLVYLPYKLQCSLLFLEMILNIESASYCNSLNKIISLIVKLQLIFSKSPYQFDSSIYIFFNSNATTLVQHS